MTGRAGEPVEGCRACGGSTRHCFESRGKEARWITVTWQIS